jgi:hypothetical protein
MENTIAIRVSYSYKQKLMGDCLELYLKSHPEREGCVTVDEMFREVVAFYLEAVVLYREKTNDK